MSFKPKFGRDLTGIVFSNLKVTSLNSRGHNTKWNCLCLMCGSKTVVSRPNLMSGNTVDCGCMKREKISKANTTHGESRSDSKPLYKRWLNMRRRVKDPRKNYLSKGIVVCEEWDDYESFRDWALSSGFDESLELDRIDNDGNYEPSNCRWISHAENWRNKGKTSLQYPVINSNGDRFETAKHAADSIGASRNSVSKAIKTGHRCKGVYWFKDKTKW